MILQNFLSYIRNDQMKARLSVSYLDESVTLKLTQSELVPVLNDFEGKDVWRLFEMQDRYELAIRDVKALSDKAFMAF